MRCSTCEDRLRNGARCAHMIAATLYRMERAATEAASPLASEAEIAAHMATTAATFRQDEAARRRLITSSPFFEDAPVAVKVRPLDRYSVLFPEGED